MEEKQLDSENSPDENIIDEYPEDTQDEIRQSLELTEDEFFNFIFKLIV